MRNACKIYNSVKQKKEVWKKLKVFLKLEGEKEMQELKKMKKILRTLLQDNKKEPSGREMGENETE